MKNSSGIMIAAAGSDCGKTLITCALLKALKNRGFNPHAFKCGPDYIDPMFHRAVLGVPSNNLDLFFVDKDKLREIYAENIQDSYIAVVEGVMGLYDGISVMSDEGSAYHIASVLDIPIILVADAKGCGRSIIAQLKGFIDYDKNKLITGIFLNRISERFYESIAPAIKEELSIPVVGYLPDDAQFSIESRHLGLKMPGEIPRLKEKIEVAAEVMEKSGFVDNVVSVPRACNNSNVDANKVKFDDEYVVTVGVARDEAFCFYYEENIKLLEAYGAKIVFFSPLHDSELPQGLDAVILGGGYPEVYAEKLAENISMRQAVKDVILGGMPSVAECGGFMYLHEFLKDSEGKEFAMCGVIPGSCFYTGKLVRFGYITVKEKQQNFLDTSDMIKGHEFHYYDSDDNGNDCVASKPESKSAKEHDLYNKTRGHSSTTLEMRRNIKWDCIYDTDAHFWGFPHLYYPSNPDFVVKFIKKARAYHNNKYIF